MYVLGSFARYVTVYAQQVRALNLIDALASSGRLSCSSRVAVIGAGVSGLTAAAAAAVRGVGRVEVFEREHQTMRIQRSSHTRWLHPHIYDWPMRTEFGLDARLPIMSWTAGYAAQVTERLDARWKEIRDKVDARLAVPRVGAERIQLKSGDDRPAVSVGEESSETFDAVILAIGFGLDYGDTTFGYWADAPWDNLQFDTAGKSFLVSGAGDGALTDLMRLCFLDFKHGHVLTAVDEATRNEVGEDLLDAERELDSVDEIRAGELLRPRYTEAAKRIAVELDRSPKLQPRQLRKIWLNCPPGRFFGRTSSILNRLITAYLLYRDRFELVEGHVDAVKRNDAGGHSVTFSQGAHDALTPDLVIVRHGPDKPLDADGVPRTWKPFSRIWKDCRQLRREWAEMRQHMDWTRDPLYEDGDFCIEPLKSPQLRVEFGGRAGCVVMTGSRKPGGLNQQQRVELALRRFVHQLGGGLLSGRAVNTTPEVIEAESVLNSSALYERAVRALCDTEIAVFDISRFESIVMLLLGISGRRASRRYRNAHPGRSEVDAAALQPCRVEPNLA